MPKTLPNPRKDFEDISELLKASYPTVLLFGELPDGALGVSYKGTPEMLARIIDYFLTKETNIGEAFAMLQMEKVLKMEKIQKIRELEQAVKQEPIILTPKKGTFFQ